MILERDTVIKYLFDGGDFNSIVVVSASFFASIATLSRIVVTSERYTHINLKIRKNHWLKHSVLIVKE